MLSGAVVYPVGIVAGSLLIVLRRDTWQTLVGLVAIAHLTILASVALFPVPLLDPTAAAGAGGPPGAGVNLVPFRTIGPVLAGRAGSGAALQLVQNVFVLFPAGMYGPLLSPALRSRWAIVPFVILGGASIELAQLVISTLIGFRYRSIDIDDAIANGVGLALGWLVVALAIAVRHRRRGPRRGRRR